MTYTTPTTCPEVPCGADQVCRDGACVSPDGCDDFDDDGYGDGCAAGPDCDDARAAIHPDATEIRNGRDDDCDGAIDDDVVETCTPLCTPGDTRCVTDAIYTCAGGACPEWGLPEPCAVGEACVGGACSTTCVDVDGDGARVRCAGELEDCDDTNPLVSPAAPELCDDADNNCNGRVDENAGCDQTCTDECAVGEVTCSSDGRSVVRCVEGSRGCGVVAPPTFCGSARSCVDGACVDEVVCVDGDGDGFGFGCDSGPDCRPSDPTASPGAPEVCDGVDQDCDDLVDDGACATECTEHPASRPLALDATWLHRVHCGGAEHIALDAGVAVSGTAAIVVSAGLHPVSFDVGSITGGDFTSAGGSTRLGLAGTWVGSVPSDPAVRVALPAGTPYTVAIAGDVRGCVADALEPNNTPISATPVGTPPFGAGLTRCATDADYFSVTAGTGDVIVATTAFDGRAGDVLPRVWWNGAEVGTGLSAPFVAGQPRARAAHFRADLPGTYTVAARGLSSTDATEYALAIDVVRPADCADDSAERTDGVDDDVISSAPALRSGRTRSGVLCPGDFDVISIGRLTEGQTYSGTFTGPANLDFLIVRDTMRSVFYDGVSDATTAEVRSNVSTTGAYYMVVFGRTADTTGTYTYTHTF